MNTNAHTPGPWTADEHRDGLDIRPALGSPADAAKIRPCIGYVPKVRFDGAGADCGQTPDEQRANARLIAAAPELLAALEAVMVFSDAHACECCTVAGLKSTCPFCQAESAIAKAKGSK